MDLIHTERQALINASTIEHDEQKNNVPMHCSATSSNRILIQKFKDLTIDCRMGNLGKSTISASSDEANHRYVQPAMGARSSLSALAAVQPSLSNAQMGLQLDRAPSESLPGCGTSVQTLEINPSTTMSHNRMPNICEEVISTPQNSDSVEGSKKQKEDKLRLRQQRREEKVKKQVQMYQILPKHEQIKYRMTKKMDSYVKRYGAPKSLSTKPTTEDLDRILVRNPVTPNEMTAKPAAQGHRKSPRLANATAKKANSAEDKVSVKADVAEKQALKQANAAKNNATRPKVDNTTKQKHGSLTLKALSKFKRAYAEGWMQSQLIHAEYLSVDQIFALEQGLDPKIPSIDQRLVMAKRQLELAGAKDEFVLAIFEHVRDSIALQQRREEDVDLMGGFVDLTAEETESSKSTLHADAESGTSVRPFGLDGQDDRTEFAEKHMIKSMRDLQLSSHHRTSAESKSRKKPASPSAASIANRTRSKVSTADWKRPLNPFGYPTANLAPYSTSVKQDPAPTSQPSPTSSYVQQASDESGLQRLEKPQTLLIIADINGTLVSPKAGRSENITASKQRPGLASFLSYIMDLDDRPQSSHLQNSKQTQMKFMIWTSARPETAARVFNNLFTPEQRARTIAVWSREYFGLTKEQYDAKTQVYKQLRRVWNDESIQINHPGYAKGHRWSQKNTVLIDDSREKAASEPFNLIQVPTHTSWRGDRERVQALQGSTSWRSGVGKPDDKTKEAIIKNAQAGVLYNVAEYLNVIRLYKDVSAYMRIYPFDSNSVQPCRKGVPIDDEHNLSDEGGVQL